ncbi:hypothetical protein [Streptomyces europaeiscabiei]|uniref:hypothetical protein n=1 Tax=Streptomyces europaeiscabiei TaxID=146819 RepID=UPI002E1595E9|nr:hypothetical protein OHB30_51135 [Streptomyces europaeiscabiei]
MKKLAALAMTGAIVGGSLLVSTTPAAAATCYGSAKNYVGYSGSYHPYSGDFFTTTSNCADINIKRSGYGPAGKVKVCFYHSNTSLNYCQRSYTEGYAGQWTEVATDVKDGVKFRFYFEEAGYKNFDWAA